MKKTLFALALLAVLIITPSCNDQFQDSAINLPEQSTPSNDGNNEGDPADPDGE